MKLAEGPRFHGLPVASGKFSLRTVRTLEAEGAQVVFATVRIVLGPPPASFMETYMVGASAMSAREGGAVASRAAEVCPDASVASAVDGRLASALWASVPVFVFDCAGILHAQSVHQTLLRVSKKRDSDQQCAMQYLDPGKASSAHNTPSPTFHLHSNAACAAQ
jgi:hypothetical protein